MEVQDRFSFIKGGLVFADWITTVSPTYASEIQTAEFGYGLEGLISQRKYHLTGIVNGVDYSVWNPGRDTQIPVQYNQRSLPRKAENKRALQEYFGLPVDSSRPLFAVISRLVEQKGIDLILKIVPELVARDAQLVILGSGDPLLESAIGKASTEWPQHIAAFLGYNEALAHQIEAGADIFLMPSRFEPCGLNQIYSQLYGTVPIVRHTGGLADTVTDTTPETLENRTATGFTFTAPTAAALDAAVTRALQYYRDPETWQQIIASGMKQDFSWKRSAEQYLALFEKVLANRRSGLIPARTQP
jgi:starch synthase